MLQIRTIINNEIKFIDLYGGEDLKINVSFNEVQDITQKNSPFTQQFKLPGTKKNNDIFNHFYDFNSSTFDYSPLSKFDAEILNNGATLYTGYIRLNSVTKTAGEIVYDVTFYSEVGNLTANIKDKYLSDLQLWVDTPWEYAVTGYPESMASTYNWDYDPDLKPSLYTSDDPMKNGNVYFSILSRGYSYLEDTETGIQEINANVIPRLNFQKPPSTNNDLTYWNSDNAPVYSEWKYVPGQYFTGSLRIKDLYEAIFRENGYKVESDFFNTAYFKKIYMPLTTSNEGLYPAQSVPSQYAFGATGATTGTSINYACSSTWAGPPPYNGLAYKRLYTSAWTVNDRYFYNTYPDLVYLYESGYYRWKITFSGVVNVDNGTLTFTYGNIPAVTSVCENFGYVDDAVTITGGTAGDYMEDEVLYLADSIAAWKFFRYYGFNIFGNGITISKINVELVEAPHYIPLYSGQPYSEDTYVAMREFIKPDIKQLDFITSVNKLFNLIVIPDYTDPTKIKVEPIIDWIGKGDELDWSDKIDKDKPITVQPLTSIINGTLDYTYAKDDGGSNKTFKEQNNDRDFGQNTISLNTDYRDKVLNFNPIFSSQVDTTLNVLSSWKGLTIPNYYVTKTQEKDGSTFVQFRPYKTPPKLLFRQPAIPLVSFGTYSRYIYINDYQTNNWSSGNRFSTYPYGATGLTHAMVWNKNDRFDLQEYDLSDYEDLYDVYYKDYIEDLTNENNRIIKASIYLKPEEVRGLQFNEKIFIDGDYYRVNKITGASLVSPNIANVELIKLTKEYEGHRIRYYDLINCTGGTDLHTSTDLNYGVYYLKGYNVSIDGECYTITGGTYNSGYTYQALDLSAPYTDCNCNVSISTNGVVPYDELRPGVTPTILPTGCTSCTYYEWENENPFAASVEYTDCDTGERINVYIGPSNVATGCTCDANTIIKQGGIRENYEEDCSPSITPTPSPSQATPTPTPTPSFTPNACYEYEIENENPYSVPYYYTDCCTGLSSSDTIGAGQVGLICSTTIPTGSIRVNSTSYPCSTSCPSPTPTPTMTKTPTPSPSQGSYPYYYEGTNCDDPGDIVCMASNTFYAISKVVHLDLLPGCYEITGTCSAPEDGVIVSPPYTDCGSCPR